MSYPIDFEKDNASMEQAANLSIVKELMFQISTDIFVQSKNPYFHNILIKIRRQIQTDWKQTKFPTVFICEQINRVVASLKELDDDKTFWVVLSLMEQLILRAFGDSAKEEMKEECNLAESIINDEITPSDFQNILTENENLLST